MHALENPRVGTQLAYAFVLTYLFVVRLQTSIHLAKCQKSRWAKDLLKTVVNWFGMVATECFMQNNLLMNGVISPHVTTVNFHIYMTAFICLLTQLLPNITECLLCAMYFAGLGDSEIASTPVPDLRFLPNRRRGQICCNAAGILYSWSTQNTSQWGLYNQVRFSQC